jgi:hypothetical protein
MKLSEYQELQKGQKPRRTPELDEQIKLFAVLRNPVLLKLYPFLKYIYSSQSGSFTSLKVAGQDKAAGKTPGVPDICVPFRRYHYSGMHIEMKSKTGTLSPEQKDFIQHLRNELYVVHVARSADEALTMIEWYLCISLGTKGDKNVRRD